MIQSVEWCDYNNPRFEPTLATAASRETQENENRKRLPLPPYSEPWALGYNLTKWLETTAHRAEEGRLDASTHRENKGYV